MGKTAASIEATLPLGIRRCRLGMSCLLLLLLAATCATAAEAVDTATTPTSPSTPIWTLVPTRIDRAQDRRERLPPLPSAEFIRRTLKVDTFPRVDRDGSFLAEGRRWRIAHVRLPDRSETCPTSGGRRWPCGVRAWATFSGLIAGRRLSCDRVEAPPGVVAPLTCALDDRSVAETLLASGWAEPIDDPPAALITAHEAAGAAQRGLWSIAIPP